MNNELTETLKPTEQEQLEDFTLPSSKAMRPSIIFFMLTVTIATLFLISQFEEYWLVIVVIGVIASFSVPLYYMVNVDEPRYQEYKVSYRKKVDSLDTKTIVAHLSSTTLSKPTKEILIDYLNKERSGWNQ